MAGWITVLMLAAAPAGAQRYLVRTYTEQDGLLNSKVADLAEAADGRIWFLTRTGLTVYDGTVWQDIVAPQGLSGRDLFRLDFDALGGVWVVGNELGSLARYDGVRWQRIPPPREAKGFDGWVTSMVVLNRRGHPQVALGTSREGLFLWDSEQWQRFTEAHGLPQGSINDVVSGGDVLYAATADGLFRFDDGSRWTDLTTLLSLPRGPLRALVLEHGPPERLWMIDDRGVGYLQDGRFEQVSGAIRIPVYRPRNRLTAGFDGRGGIYFGNPAAAFHLSSSGVLERFGKKNGLLADGATAFLLDREDNLWVSSFRGVSKVSSRRFATYDREHGLLGDEVTAIAELASGELVFGHDAGLTFYDAGRLRTVSLERGDLAAADLGKQVLDLAADPQGTLWAAVANQGLARLTADGELSWMLGGAGNGRVDTVRVDDRGTVWVGTRRGLFRLDGTTLVPITEPALARVRSRRLVSGRGGALYLATSVDGLFLRRDGVWSHYQGVEGPPSNSLFAVHEQTEGAVWVGADAGLLKLEDGALRRPREPELQIHRPVYLLAEDRVGRLWIGTDFGVRLWDGETLRSYTVREGLAGNSTNRAAGLVDRYGQVWIGTDRGVSCYQENLDRKAALPPRIGQLELEVGDERRSLDSEVRLDYTTNQILFHARALTFVDEEHVRYRSQLEGLDDAWIETESTTRFESRYPLIPPGTYRFHLQARNSESGWSTVTSAPIILEQPFWQQGWFFLLLASALGGLGFSIQHYLAQRRYSRRLEDEVRLRTTALATSEQAIAAERERLSVTLASIADGVIATDREGRVLLLNQAAEKLTGWSEEEALRRPLKEVLPLRVEDEDASEAISPVQAVLDAAQPLRFPLPYALRNRAGNEVLLELIGAPVRRVAEESLGVVLAFRDVSEQKKAEEERARTQKLEAIGVLAGGIAHDFNNILTGIMGHLSLARMIGLGDEKAGEHVEKAEKAVGRASGLARQLLTFARGGAPMTGPASIGELVAEAVPFVFSGSNIRYQIDLEEDLWPVEIDQGQISQVLGNLLINASQAMPEGGSVDIVGRNVHYEEPTSALRDGSYVCLSVKDYGVGIAPRHLRRIFDPYFTTKQTGSGLGLATAYSIMQKHGGAITVESQLDVGTCFNLYMPAAEEHSAPEAVELEEDIRPIGSGKILLMDDEESVLSVLEEMLGHLGYQTVRAADGEVAVALYRQALEDGRPFDLVILDLTVPGGTGGKETLSLLREIDPRVNAVVSSGYSEDPVMSHHREHGLRGVLAKPYRMLDVAQLLREIFAD